MDSAVYWRIPILSSCLIHVWIPSESDVVYLIVPCGFCCLLVLNDVIVTTAEYVPQA